jgi:hypothetical protein
MMRRKRRLSELESKWVNTYIREACEQEKVKFSDEQYHSTGWVAFLNYYQSCNELCFADFWPTAFMQIRDAIHLDKQIRTDLLYRELSLNRPVTSESTETFLDFMFMKNGDFTNGVAFFDFLDHLSEELRQLSGCILVGYTLEEARSQLNWTNGELINAVDILRKALCDYESI